MLDGDGGTVEEAVDANVEQPTHADASPATSDDNSTIAEVLGLGGQEGDPGGISLPGAGPIIID